VKVIVWNVIVRTEPPAAALETKGIRIAPTQWRSADVSVERSLRAKYQPQEIATMKVRSVKVQKLFALRAQIEPDRLAHRARDRRTKVKKISPATPSKF
jgi:hypothetical protein